MLHPLDKQPRSRGWQQLQQQLQQLQQQLHFQVPGCRSQQPPSRSPAQLGIPSPCCHTATASQQRQQPVAGH